jgi:hypothetical protein
MLAGASSFIPHDVRNALAAIAAKGGKVITTSQLESEQ